MQVLDNNKKKCRHKDRALGVERYELLFEILTYMWSRTSTNVENAINESEDNLR